MRKKRKLKRKVIIVLGSLTIIFLLGLCLIIFDIHNSVDNKLKRIGYKNSEVEIIKDNLSNETIEKLLDEKYLKELSKLIKDNRFIEKDLFTYIKELESGKSVDELFENDTKEENNKDNENISNKEPDNNNEIEKVPENNQDTTTDNTNNLKKQFKSATYYIEKNIDRYLSYLNENPNKDINEVVRSVNSNIDYEFYTNVVSTNMNYGYLILVNKYTKLDENYTPTLVTMSSTYSYGNMQMETVAYEHFKQMVDAAKNDGIKLYNISSYRSYSTQSGLYNNYVNSSGKTAADRFSARAGYSEHQTGLATDINTASSADHFENTKEYQWLINNCHKYGFILRYPQGREYITGYKFEPWHYRYVGVDVATYVMENNITFEEYYAYFVDNK